MSSSLLLSKLSTAPLLFFDTETTGLYPERGDRMCEIALVRTVNGQVEKTYDTLIYPERPIPEEASRISGITDAMVWEKPRFSEVVPKIQEMAEGAVLVAHNAPFDLSFLLIQMQEAGHEMLKNLVIDTLPLARRCYKLSDYSLGGLAQALRIQKETAHRALGDTIMTSRVFTAMLPMLAQKKLATVGHVLQFQGGSARPSLKAAQVAAAG